MNPGEYVAFKMVIMIVLFHSLSYHVSLLQTPCHYFDVYSDVYYTFTVSRKHQVCEVKFALFGAALKSADSR